MNLYQIRHLAPPPLSLSQPIHLSHPHSLCPISLLSHSLPSISLPNLNLHRFTPLPVSRVKAQIYGDGELGDDCARNGSVYWASTVEAQTYGNGELREDLAQDGVIFQKTLRLVECSMFAAVAGLAYFLSNSLAVEVATGMLLLVLSGPVKALTYLLMHGLVGFTMGTLWRLGTNWGLSVLLCAFVRAFGAIGYVLISSFLIRENILALITINIHASLTFIITSLGINAIPSMDAIYALFGTLLMLNCGFFVFLLHILYAVLFARLGMKGSLNLPRWLKKAI